MCRIEELCRKDVVNVRDGSRLGCVEDVEIDVCEGKVCSLIIYGRAKCFGLLGREEDICIPWNDIQKIGEDAILVCYEGLARRRPKRRNLFEFFR